MLTCSSCLGFGRQPAGYYNHDNVYGAIIMIQVIARVHPVHLMNVDWAPGGRQPSDLANELELWVRRKLAATIHTHHRHCYYYSARKLILILPSHVDGRLNWQTMSVFGTRCTCIVQKRLNRSRSVLWWEESTSVGRRKSESSIGSGSRFSTGNGTATVREHAFYELSVIEKFSNSNEYLKQSMNFTSLI